MENYIDKIGLALLWEKVKNKLSSKVEKEVGKGLSSNDYSSDDKAKLTSIEVNAQVNTLEGIQRNGMNVAITNKIANIAVPEASSASPSMDGKAAVGSSASYARADHVHPSDTSKADKSTTLSGYGILDAYTKSETDAEISKAAASITGISYSVVDSLPDSGAAGTIYLIKDTHSYANDVYDEYIFLSDGTWEKLGNTDIDLSDYQTKMTPMTETEINAICV